MNDGKPLASLTSGLLARKGGARPAMRPQLQPLNNYPVGGLSSGNAALSQDDLGWNDMGEGWAAHDAVAGEAANEFAAPPVDFSEPEDFPVDGAVYSRTDLSETLKASIREMEDHAGYDEDEDEGEEATAEGFDRSAEDAEDESEEATYEGAEIVQLSGGVERAFVPPAEMPAVIRQREDIVERIVVPETPQAGLVADRTVEPLRRLSRPRRSAIEAGRRAAFTLRLDAERHLKLKLASTIKNASAQLLVTEALDRLFEDMPELGELAARARRR